MAFQPTILQAKTLSLLPYEEGKVMRIAYIDNKRNYFFRPKKILTDYEKAKWKTGFIKQLVPFVKNPHRIDSLIKKVNRNRPNQLFSILSVKIPVAQPRITSPSAYSPLRPDTHSKIPLQGCWDGCFLWLPVG